MTHGGDVVCPSGTKSATEDVNGTLFVICINDSSKFTAIDFLILLFIVLFLIGLGLCCTYLKYKHDENERNNRPKIINGIQLYDSSFERLRDTTIPLSCPVIIKN
jgi:hypothetical protein